MLTKANLRTLRNKTKYLFRVIRGRLCGKRFPLEVFFNVTNRCNLNCLYCFGDYHHRLKDREYTTQELLRLVDTVADHGACLLHIQGGEPLLRKDLAVVVQRAHRRGLLADINSNGVLVDQRLDVIKELDAICFSIDGPKEVTDVTRGIGVYDSVVNGLNAAAKFDIPKRVNMVVTKYSWRPENIAFMANFAKERNCILNISIPYLPRCGRTMEDYCAAPEQVKAALDEVLKLKTQDFPIQYSEESIRFSRNWSQDFSLPIKSCDSRYESKNLPNVIPCRFPQFMCFVEADGNIYPCFQQCATDFKPKNWLIDGFDTAWNHVGNVHCETCAEISYQERNRIFSLSPRIIVNNVLVTLIHNLMRVGGR